MVIPALAMAQRDRHQDDLDEAAGDSISRNTRELVEEMNEEYVDSRGAFLRHVAVHKFAIRNGTNGSRGRIVCVPTRTSADETIGIMLVQLLEREGEPAQCIPLSSFEEMIDQLVEHKPDVVVISALQPFALTHIRKLYSQIRARLPQDENFSWVVELQWRDRGCRSSLRTAGRGSDCHQPCGGGEDARRFER